MRIVFCGVGALGSQAAVLCRNLDASFAFVDFDRVESKNLLSQAFVKQSVGKNKADALKLQLANFFGTKAESFGVRLSDDNADALLSSADLVIDCFDNQKSRLLLSDWCRAHEKPLVHAALAADGSFGLVRWDAQFAADPEDHEGQATCEGGEHLPLIGLLTAALARSVQDFVKHGVQRDFMVSLGGVAETSSSD
jgi:molybdopterin/thiamine biosynthesis adenylyltransferase